MALREPFTVNPLPFHLVTLTHATWAAALACAERLPEDALPELRLDLFPEADPEALVGALGGPLPGDLPPPVGGRALGGRGRGGPPRPPASVP